MANGVKHLLISANALAPRLSVSAEHLRRMARQGKISHYEIGGRLLFDEEEVLREARRAACLSALKEASRE